MRYRYRDCPHTDRPREPPDLTPLRKATETVGTVTSDGAVAIYESTVDPSCTKDYCVPIPEQLSGLKLNEGFFIVYSPERVNPGDKEHGLSTITKVTSGSTAIAADAIDRLYRSIVAADALQAGCKPDSRRCDRCRRKQHEVGKSQRDAEESRCAEKQT